MVLTDARRVATIYRPSHDGAMSHLDLSHTLPQSARCSLNESVCFAIDHGGAIVVFDVLSGVRLYRLGDNVALRGSSCIAVGELFVLVAKWNGIEMLHA